MVKSTLRLIVLFLFIKLPILSYSATFTAQMNGSWDDPATWGESTAIPGINDDVFIDGFGISLLTTSTFNVNSITIHNPTNSANTGLTIEDGVTLNITTDLQIIAYAQSKTVYLNLLGTAKINVLGNMLVERAATNSENKDFQILLSNTSQIEVQGNFTYNYVNSGNENKTEFILRDTSVFTVHGNVYLLQKDGVNLDFDVLNSASFIVKDSFIMESTGGGKILLLIDTDASLQVENYLGITNAGSSEIEMKVKGGATATINGDVLVKSTAVNQIAEIKVESTGSILDINKGNLYLNANANQTVLVKVSGTSAIKLEGNIIRENVFGAFEMTNNAKLILDGTSPQDIPERIVSGAGTDLFDMTNIVLENSGGTNLKEDLILTRDLTLTRGILNTSDAAMLILEDGANISGGSDIAYIDGPVMKRGTHDGTSFLFPVGDNGVYAPIEIEAITNVNLEYTAEFVGCPPPIGAVTAPLEVVNEAGYWTLDRSDGQSVGNITLHWDDADAIGITDLSSLVVTYYDSSSGWFPLGQSNLTGSIGVGSSGSLQSDVGCPPPIGISTFALGSTNAAENALPVELAGFSARRMNNSTKVLLEWYTTSEENSNKFIVQKSFDGVSFTDLGEIVAAGNSVETNYYSLMDEQPEKGNNYYRIVQIDLDERMTFSGLANVFVKVNDEIPIVYPNPVRDQLKVYSKSFEDQQEILITITDINGQNRYRGVHKTQNKLLFLAVQGLNIDDPGLYFLTYKGTGNASTVEIFKATN